MKTYRQMIADRGLRPLEAEYILVNKGSYCNESASALSASENVDAVTPPFWKALAPQYQSAIHMLCLVR